MLKTKSSRLLLLLTDPEHIHRFFFLLLVLAATCVFWLESTGTPTTARQTPSDAWTPAAFDVEPETSPLPSTADPRIQIQTPAMKTDHQNTVVYANNYRLEKQSDASQGDWFQLLHKKLGTDGRSGNWVRVEAGYGQLCRMESDFGQRSLELEQPRCAYLKAGFSF